MTETPSSQSGSTPVTPQQPGSGVGEGKRLALGLLFAIAKESGDPNVLADLDDYLPPKSQ